tara:strand:- start:1940 stop:3739 length:1800 start_codon:yes stop_codon:yes gene_type:complete
MITKSLKATFLLLTLILFIPYSAFADVSESQKRLLETLPPDQRDSIMQKMNEANDLQEEIEEFVEENSLIERDEIEEDSENLCQDCIFGYDFFKFSPSTFVQTSIFPVPSDYLLGPGDKIEIIYNGSNNLTKDSYISRNGNLALPIIGPVNIAGKTFKDASVFLQNRVRSVLIGTEVTISVKELRSISVFILGEAYKPGLFTISGLSSISNALFVAGGVNEQGSLRNIEVRRNGEKIANYDFYEFLLKGKVNKDLRLQDGDVLFIPFIENRVRIDGAFKRPAIYEFKTGETVDDAIALAGGFLSNVPPNVQLEISSIDPGTFERKIGYLSLGSSDMGKELKNEDTINVTSSPKVVSKTIKLSGEFNRPGVYSLNSGDRLLDLINRAGGFTSDAYEEGAIFLREEVAKSQKDGFNRSADQLERTIVNIISQGILADASEATLAPLSTLIRRLREIKPVGRMVVDLDLLELKTNPVRNFRLQDGDSIHIPERPYSVSIVGEVLNSSSQSFDPDLKTEDYIDLAGGLNDTADESRIFVIYPNGTSKILKKSLFNSSNYLLPGSTIVVSRKSRPLDGVNIAQIVTPILADLATSAAAIAAISD